MNKYIKINLCKAHVHPKYIATSGLVFADIVESGIVYSDVRISRITVNKLFEGQCVYGKLVPLTRSPLFPNAIVANYTFKSLPQKTQP